MSPPDVARRLIVRRHPTQEELDARESRVIKAARDLVVGKGPCLPPSEQWDRDFLEFVHRPTLRGFRPHERRGDRPRGRLRRPRGAHLGRGRRRRAQMGNLRTELRYYHLVPEWITGMGIVVGQG